MFENLTQSKSTPGVEDIFSKTEGTALSSQPSSNSSRPLESLRSPFQPVSAQASAASELAQVTNLSEPQFSHKRWWLILAVGVVILGLLGFGYWWSGRPESSIQTPEPAPAQAPEPKAQEVPAEQPTPLAPVDTDGDGLLDSEEQSLGTSALSSDTDSDGLFDRDEVRVYQTDPLNPDTDADGYPDGVEVQNGYNPKGPGQLLELPQG